MNVIKGRTKTVIVAVLTIILLVCGCNNMTLNVNAAVAYNREEAISFAQNYWNKNSEWLCAEFVSRCVRAGGINIGIEAGTGPCIRAICAATGLQMQDLVLDSSGYATKAGNQNVLDVGDVVIQWCTTCNNGQGISPHVVLCGGFNSQGRATYYAHNNPMNNGIMRLNYSRLHTESTCNVVGKVIHLSALGNTGYEPQGEFDTVTSENGTITVRGWAFDRDDLNAQLDIHVYVGGPSLSGAPCYVIKANKERKDVNEAYPGVGNYHGFEETITVSARGQTEVYVYAINNVKNQHNPLLGQKTINISNGLSIDFESNSNSVKAGESAVMNFKFTGDDIARMRYSIEDTDVCSAEWGTTDWKQGKSSLTIYGKQAGNTKVIVKLVDSNDLVLYQKSFNVIVGAVKGDVTVSPSWLFLNTTNKRTGEVTLDFSDCKNATQIYRDYTDKSIIEETYEFDGSTVTFTYTAKKAGQTQVVYTFVDAYGNEVGKTTAEIIVEQLVTGIELDVKNIALRKGDSYWITETITPSDANDKRIYWSSSNTSVATVDANGLIKAVGKGEATITAEAEDGSGVSASCKVTVKQPVTALSLSKSVLMLNKYDSYQLISEIEPSDADNKSVIWRSSDTSVATVDASGLVTAVGKGEATITVTSVDDPGFSLTCEVTVKQPVTSLTLDKNTLTLNNTDGYILTATVKPTDANNKLVSWSSSNPSVATVNDSGFVRAVGRGEAIITATAKDGSGVSASCKVTVKQQVTWLTLNVNELTLNKSENYTLTTTVTPSNANNTVVSWSSSDTSVATVDANGLVKAVGKGEATITAIATDGSGVMAQCKVKVTEPMPEPIYRFADVSEGTWQYNVAKYAVEAGLMKGKGNTAEGLIIFEPDKNMTRAEFVQTLYNKEGKPAVNYTVAFKDVPAGQWYTNAILWAAQNNIVAGKGEIFDVSGNITRQEMATILYKYATNFKGYETAGRTGFDGYVDADSISSWATENMKWAIHYGIMKGQGNKLAPQDNATRAECAAMLKNFMDVYE